jgi:hypothetical protein
MGTVIMNKNIKRMDVSCLQCLLICVVVSQ